MSRSLNRSIGSTEASTRRRATLARLAVLWMVIIPSPSRADDKNDSRQAVDARLELGPEARLSQDSSTELLLGGQVRGELGFGVLSVAAGFEHVRQDGSRFGGGVGLRGTVRHLGFEHYQRLQATPDGDVGVGGLSSLVVPVARNDEDGEASLEVGVGALLWVAGSKKGAWEQQFRVAGELPMHQGEKLAISLRLAGEVRYSWIQSGFPVSSEALVVFRTP